MPPCRNVSSAEKATSSLPTTTARLNGRMRDEIDELLQRAGGGYARGTVAADETRAARRLANPEGEQHGPPGDCRRPAVGVDDMRRARRVR